MVFFVWFFVEFKELLPSLDMVTLKSSNDNERPLGVVSWFSISNFKLGALLYGGSGLLFLH